MPPATAHVMFHCALIQARKQFDPGHTHSILGGGEVLRKSHTQASVDSYMSRVKDELN